MRGVKSLNIKSSERVAQEEIIVTNLVSRCCKKSMFFDKFGMKIAV